MKNKKKYTLFILLTITNFSNILFAQSFQKKHEVINSYIESIIKNTKNEKIFIAKEKINTNITIDILKKDWIYAIDSTGNWTFDKLFFDEKCWEKMKKDSKNKCVSGRLIWCNEDYWVQENFIYKNIILESMNTNKGIQTIFEKYNKLDLKVYGFSEPIYYRNNKYIIFTVNICGFNSSNIYIVIMKKNKDKWIVTHEGRDPDLIN